MTDGRAGKTRKFAHEILGLIGISALFAFSLFWILIHIAAAVAESYCFQYDVPMTEFDWMEVDRWIFALGAVFSGCLFCVLFLSLLGERLAYIRKLTAGIDAMREGQNDDPVPLEGNNELTELANAINYMSAARQQLLEKERALAQEKDALVRTLSHDIRTPLTSILAYSEYLAEAEALSPQEQKKHLQMIGRKAQQIRELTEILLHGAKRDLEHFEDGRLLMQQLAAEFEAELEDRFPVRLELSGCGSFRGCFDVQELRRIFDNLSSNVEKYADPMQPVQLCIRANADGILIRQSNGVLPDTGQRDSYQLGIPSIRRIAQHYDGSVAVTREEDSFVISILLCEF